MIDPLTWIDLSVNVFVAMLLTQIGPELMFTATGLVPSDVPNHNCEGVLFAMGKALI